MVDDIELIHMHCIACVLYNVHAEILAAKHNEIHKIMHIHRYVFVRGGYVHV